MCRCLLFYCTLFTVVSSRKIIDLTYDLNSETHKWPTGDPFRLTVDANGTNAEGKWYASNTVRFSEHTGTHLDAPSHFAMFPGVYYANTIPVERLVCPVALFDLSSKAAEDRDYQVTPEDISNYEENFGTIKEGSVVIFSFGWYKYWDNYTAYFGTPTNDTTQLHFPGIGIDAAKILDARKIYGVGIDTPSIDYGRSTTFDVHYYLLEKNIYFLENVADTSALPAGGLGTTLIVGVLKTEGGTGGPARLIALVDDPVNSVLSVRISNCHLLLCAVILINI